MQRFVFLLTPRLLETCITNAEMGGRDRREKAPVLAVYGTIFPRPQNCPAWRMDLLRQSGED